MDGLSYRQATAADLPAIIAGLADDELGRQRDNPALPLDKRYLDAFHAIVADPRQQFIVVERGGVIVGFFQLTFIPGLSNKGAWRGLVESVRVMASQRSKGIGEAMIRHAMALCREQGCAVLQLTTDKRRTDAHRFYRKLGFVGSHEGFKIVLA
jgi:ribosomal protein S18 acetylase RimI-like enzyme